MIATEDYEVRILRAWDAKHKKNQITSLPGWRAAWLLKHGFIETVQAKPPAAASSSPRGRKPKFELADGG